MGTLTPWPSTGLIFKKKNLSKSVLAFSRQQQQEMLQQAAKHVEKTNEEIVRVQVVCCLCPTILSCQPERRRRLTRKRRQHQVEGPGEARLPQPSWP